ncbi:hypothetical protein Dda_7433 [Drechslerella dactyloides]|uniref:Uncharacterized protein n=1 Tax=Drechslerella dactyloides TaxID=74499 RepID=A0AAD6ISL7_DREDA|nr:hypothetical protein Dda_7433 [Drechslerella dactyloides]
MDPTDHPASSSSAIQRRINTADSDHLYFIEVCPRSQQCAGCAKMIVSREYRLVEDKSVQRQNTLTSNFVERVFPMTTKTQDLRRVRAQQTSPRYIEEGAELLLTKWREQRSRFMRIREGKAVAVGQSNETLADGDDTDYQDFFRFFLDNDTVFGQNDEHSLSNLLEKWCSCVDLLNTPAHKLSDEQRELKRNLGEANCRVAERLLVRHESTRKLPLSHDQTA